MTASLNLSAAVVFVRELARSEEFYRDVLGLRTVVNESEALLMEAPSGDRLVLRELPRAPQISAGIGVHYLVWTAPNQADLDECESALKARGVLVSSTVEQGNKIVEGRDPDGISVMVVCPSSPDATLSSVPPRSYAY